MSTLRREEGLLRPATVAATCGRVESITESEGTCDLAFAWDLTAPPGDVTLWGTGVPRSRGNAQPPRTPLGP